MLVSFTCGLLGWRLQYVTLGIQHLSVEPVSGPELGDDNWGSVCFERIRPRRQDLFNAGFTDMRS